MKLFPTALFFLFLATPLFADETEVFFDGSNAEKWDTSRDIVRLNNEFSLSNISQLTEPVSMQWEYIPKDAAFNDLFMMKPIQRKFTSIRVHLRNMGAEFRFSMKARDDSGAEWSANGPILAANSDWQWVELPIDAWQIASWSHDPDGKLNFPLAGLTLISFDIKNGVKYSLQVEKIEIVRPDSPVAQVTNWDLPRTLEAGKQYPLSFDFILNRPCIDDDAYLSLQLSGKEIGRVQLTLPKKLTDIAVKESVSVENVLLKIPLYAVGGKQKIVLVLGEARIVSPDFDKEGCPVTINARQPKSFTTEVKRLNGTPTICIDCHPHNGMAWATYGPTSEVFRDFGQAGVTLFTFSGTPTQAGYGLSATTWIGPDEYDYTQFDQRVQMLLAENPDAYFFPRLYVHAPKWWSEQHPDDMVQFDPGDGKPIPFIHSGDLPTPSWASEAWRQATIEGLKKMIAHIEASPYADRIIGYHIASGTTEEWMMWGSNEDAWVDYSPVNIARFRQWLKEEYTTEAALQKAWHDNSVTFATATIPLKAQRETANFGSLRDPDTEQAVVDFYKYNSDLVADTICTFAKAVKDITKRTKIVGTFYGYLLQLCGEQRQQNSGHLALAKVLSSPDIDFVTSPTSYAFRELGGNGTPHFMSLYGSVKAHGKVWFNENDVRTSLAGGQVGEWGRAADVDGDIIQQDKELGYAIVNGSSQWWFDVGSNRYNDPRLMDHIALLTQAATRAMEFNRASADEVALIVDERSLCYLRTADPLGSWLLLGQLPALHRIGTPVGHYLVTDLARIPDKKVYIFATGFAPTDEDRRAIDALKNSGKTLVFLYAPGIYRDGQIDETGMEDLTGIKLRMSTEPTSVRVGIGDVGGLTTDYAGTTYGNERKTWPSVWAVDPDATTLGTLDNGRPGLVVKDFGTWTSIFSAAPLLPSWLLGRIVDEAKVHRYIDTEDQVWASKDLIGVCVKEGGSRTIKLPRKAVVRDLYTGAFISGECKEFTTDFAPLQTRVFTLE